jgi:hypothetical protein
MAPLVCASGCVLVQVRTASCEIKRTCEMRRAHVFYRLCVSPQKAGAGAQPLNDMRPPHFACCRLRVPCAPVQCGGRMSFIGCAYRHRRQELHHASAWADLQGLIAWYAKYVGAGQLQMLAMRARAPRPNQCTGRTHSPSQPGPSRWTGQRQWCVCATLST